MYYKDNNNEKIVCPEYEREVPYSAADEKKVDEIIKAILDIDITTMNNGEEYTNALDTYLNNFEIDRLKNKIKLILEK